MRRPHEMRMIGLDRYEYQLIGEIVVLSGILEQNVKELIVKMVRAPWPEGMVLVAHLNFRSLCDIALALIPSTVPDAYNGRSSLRKAFESVLKDALRIYDERSDIVHGPFDPFVTLVGVPKSTFKITGRGKFKYKGATYDRETLSNTLETLIEIHTALFGCALWLEIERGESTLPPSRTRSRKVAQKANPQKS